MKVEPAQSHVATVEDVANIVDRKPDSSEDDMTGLVKLMTVDLRAARADHKPLPSTSRTNNSLGLSLADNPTSND